MKPGDIIRITRWASRKGILWAEITEPFSEGDLQAWRFVAFHGTLYFTNNQVGTPTANNSFVDDNDEYAVVEELPDEILAKYVAWRLTGCA